MGEWEWGTAMSEADGTGAFDRRTIFEQRCRQKGTRINWIMTMIELGLDDKEIAARVRTRTGMPCDRKTINVYRKALEGRLCDMRTGRGNQSMAVSLARKVYKRVGRMYFEEGKSRMGIAMELGIKRKTVDSCIDKYRRETGATRIKGAKKYE